MVMAKEMTMAMPEAVSMAEAAVTVTMAAGEGRSRDCQRCRGKRESAKGGRNDLFDASHMADFLDVTCSAGIALPCRKP